MELTPLRYFTATARHLNYTRAAEELFLSRQALRQSIQTLEKELGTPLFGIQKNHLHLTPAGEFLLQKAEELYAEGVYVNPVLPPATAPANCLLRTSYMATLTHELIDEALDIFQKVFKS